MVALGAGLGVSTDPDRFAWADGELQRRLVVRCALARICGSCGRSLGRPIAFLATDAEVDRNEPHLPPMHLACAEALRGAPDLPADAHRLLTTAGFEFVRPAAGDPDPEPRFRPNSLLSVGG